MKFWDSSAIVPLIVPEPESELVRILHQKDPEMIVWALSITEIYSSLYRKIRQQELTEVDFAPIRSRLLQLASGWSEVVQLETTRTKAHRLLAVHSLTAADALQLAAALFAFEDQPEGRELVTFDKNLATAAKREGFTVSSHL